MKEHLLRCANALISVIRVIAGLLLAASVGVNFVNIIGRYFLSVSLSWAEEMMLFLMVGCVFLGAGLVGWSGRQVRMDVVVSLLPERPRRAFELLADIALIATSLAVAILAWPVVSMLAGFDERSEAANIPLVIPQAMVPIGLSLMALLVIIRLIVERGAGGHPGERPDR